MRSNLTDANARRLTELKRRLRGQGEPVPPDSTPQEAAQATTTAAPLPMPPEHAIETSFAALFAPLPQRAAGDTQTPPVAENEFRTAIGAVRSVRTGDLPPEQPKPAIEAKQSQADEARVLEELLQAPGVWDVIDGAEQVHYLAEGYSPKLLRKLRRGQFQISDEFDLHHENSVQAKRLLHQFLHHHSAEHSVCVRIIHGKGLRSESGAVLKSMVDSELRRRKDVVAFCSPPQALGGTGALLVLLRMR